jgi:hypothetical protein
MRRFPLLRCVALSFLIPFLLVVAAPARAAVGSVTGIVQGPGGEPLESASVMVLGTEFGAITGHDGRFQIRNLPTGTYEIRVLLMGFRTEIRKNVVVSSGLPLELEITLVESVVARFREVRVEARRTKVDRDETQIIHRMDTENIDALPIDTVKELAELENGVTLQAGELHVNGERGGLQIVLGDVKIAAPLGGTYEPMTNGTATAELVTGGFNAEYGDFSGGLLIVTTPEGSDRFSGSLDYSTDDFGAPDKTYDNFDRLGLAFGGPTSVRGLSYFMAFQGTLEDGFLKTCDQGPRQTILDFIREGPRQSNELNAQGKLAWRVGPNQKLTFEVLKQNRRHDIYSHLFSRDGYVETRVDTLRDGSIAVRYGRFSAAREDSTFVPYNAAGHTPDVHDDFSAMNAVWTHTLSRNTFYSVKLSRMQFDFDMRVGGQRAWEYNGDAFQPWTNQIDFKTEPFFATHGDYPRLTERHTATWLVKNDFNHRIGEHEIKTGAEARYNDLQLFSIQFPLTINPDDTYGAFRSQYHYYNPEGSWYVQDRWLHEGMVLNAGFRVDLFSVGQQLDLSEVESRSRNQVSPRVGIAYPISDRDVFSFHYGRFSKVPDRASIFENRSVSSQVRGNPNLVNETSVAYQAAFQHMFTKDVFGQFGVYFKDIFGLLSIERLSQGNNPGFVNTFVNKDYASARGFEVSIEKKFSHYFGGELSYGYSQASGVASDPNQQLNTALLYLPISEQPLDWDQRHSVSAQMIFQKPEDWLASVIWTYGSGFPFTPSSRNERKLDPSLTNSRRLPSITSLNMQFEKHYTLWRQDMKFFLRGNNVLDVRNIADLEPDNWPNPPSTNNNDYRAFYTETGRAGGAYLGEDVNQDGIEDWIPVNDPRVFQEGRSVRMGLGMKF